MKQSDWRIGLKLNNNYNLAPNKFAFTVITKGPSHIPIKRFVKAYYELPFVLNAHRLAVNKVMQRGPHISHYFLIF